MSLRQPHGRHVWLRLLRILHLRGNCFQRRGSEGTEKSSRETGERTRNGHKSTSQKPNLIPPIMPDSHARRAQFPSLE